MSLDERSLFWGVIFLVILSRKVHGYMFSIGNGLRDNAISLYCSNIVDKKYVLLLLTPVFVVQVTKLVQFT
jgi:hypothetical protein